MDNNTKLSLELLGTCWHTNPQIPSRRGKQDSPLLAQHRFCKATSLGGGWENMPCGQCVTARQLVQFTLLLSANDGHMHHGNRSLQTRKQPTCKVTWQRNDVDVLGKILEHGDRSWHHGDRSLHARTYVAPRRTHRCKPIVVCTACTRWTCCVTACSHTRTPVSRHRCSVVPVDWCVCCCQPAWTLGP
jgi:hypothetical protein